MKQIPAIGVRQEMSGKELHHDARSFRWIEDAWQDAVHAVRLLRRSPLFTVTAALSLAVGIGANSAIFTVANALLFRAPTGIANPSDLVVIGSARGDGGLNPLSYATYLEVSRRTTRLTSVFAEDLFPHVMGLMPPGTDTAEPVLGRAVTTNFFSALGSVPLRGRVFTDGDENTAVLDHDYWRRRFNSDDTIVGSVVRINGRSVTVVGVAAPDFHGTGVQRCDVWLAIGSSGTSARSLMAGARRRSEVTFDGALAELRAVGQAIDLEQRAGADRTPPLGALPFTRAGANRNIVRGFTIALMVLVSLVLAAACANVAGIMLTRATARAREITLRAALGARRGRLVRQLLTETIVLFLIGGLLGVAIAGGLAQVALLSLPALSTSVVVPLTIDWRVLLFAMSLSICAAVTFGVLPAFKGSNVDANSSLRDGGRSSSGRSRLRGALVVGQIASSVLLVVLATSFVRVLRHAGAADPGFEARGVDVATLDVATAGESKVSRLAFWRSVIDRVRQMPAVESASLVRVPPGGLEGIRLGGVAPGDQPVTTELFSPGWNIVDTGYFSTLRIPIVAGRDFALSDTSGAEPVVIVSQTIARRFWPGQSAVGKPLRLSVFNATVRREESRMATIVGVAGDIRSSSLVDGLAEPYVYVPLTQSDAVGTYMTAQMSIVARRRGDSSLAAAMAIAVQDVDPRLVLTRMEPLTGAIAYGLTPQRILATISGSMGLIALLLASMGIYGVTAYEVALRRREFAIRLALGATRFGVLRMVFRQSTWLVVVGLAIGLALGIGAGRVLSMFFYGLPAAHLPTLFGTIVLFLAIGATASIIPGGRAVRDGWRCALHED